MPTNKLAKLKYTWILRFLVFDFPISVELVAANTGFNTNYMPNRGYKIHSRDRDGSPTPTGVSEFFELRRSSGWVLQTCTFVVRYSWWKALFACTNLINNINSQNVQMIFVLSFWYEIALFDDLLFFAGSIISGISHRMQFGKCGAYTACIYSIQIECFSNVFFFLSLSIFCTVSALWPSWANKWLL